MELQEVGFVKDAHGIRGELFLRFFTKEPAWLAQYTEVILGASAKEIQKFSIKKIKPHKNGYIVKLDEVKNRNHAEELKGSKLYIPADMLVSAEGEDIYLAEIEGFLVKDLRLGDIGVIEQFRFNGAQDLLVVNYDGREVEIPYVEAFIIKENFEQKVIEMDLPEGLVDGEV